MAAPLFHARRLRALLVCAVALVFFWPLGPERAGAAGKSTCQQRFLAAQACERALLASPQKQKYRDQWMACIRKYQEVWKADPDGPWAPAGIYNAACLYRKLFLASGDPSYRTEALDLFNRVVLRFPSSAYREKAEAAMPELKFKSSLKRATRKPGLAKPAAPADDEEEAPAEPEDLSPSVAPDTKGLVTVSDIRFWSSPTYTRVALRASGAVTAKHFLLKENQAAGKPPRLVVDIPNSRVSKKLKTSIPIKDDLLNQVRISQNTQDTVRLVADLKSLTSYEVFFLQHPDRVIIDVKGSEEVKGSGEEPAPKAKPAPVNEPPLKIPPGALARQLALGVKKIVVDPGHGGKDHGAPGYDEGIREKDLTLRIATRLAKKLRDETGCQVLLTREKDRYLTLEARTAIANTRGADLFISIHANAAADKGAHGIETYFLNLAADEEAIRVAALENQTSKKSISDLQGILKDLMQNNKISESRSLAFALQSSLCDRLKKKYSKIKDKGVKGAPFYVLLGARMPAVLVETSFLSNPRECERLASPAYQEALCDGIVKGLKRYMRGLKPAM